MSSSDQSAAAPITAVVTAYKRLEQTLVTLRKLLECIPPPAEIIVHVDGNQDSCANAVRKAFPNVRVLLSAEHLGPGGGRNKLLAAASHPIVACFDDDSYPLDTDYFHRLASVFRCFPEAGIVAARFYERGANVEPVTETVEWVADFCGCACAYRRGVLERVGGYVPLPLAYGMEEVDVALRLHAQGGRILRAHCLRVFHDTDLSRHGSSVITAASIRNLALLAYLRYPRRLWWIGAAQCLNRIIWLIRHGRFAGILAGLLGIPVALARNRSYITRVPGQSVRSYLALRRSPRPASPNVDEQTTR